MSGSELNMSGSGLEWMRVVRRGWECGARFSTTLFVTNF